jgi:hypothetical protein
MQVIVEVHLTISLEGDILMVIDMEFDVAVCIQVTLHRHIARKRDKAVEVIISPEEETISIVEHHEV